MENNLYAEVRRAILEQKEPFCIVDLYHRLEGLTDDRDLILEELEELYSRVVIIYEAIGENLWAFVVS